MNFKEKIYNKLKKVPKGKLTTYKDLANSINSKAYRAVGNALNKNKDKKVPCFKVIKSDGNIGGYALGIKKKIKLFKKEGFKIKNNKVVNFKKYLYKFNKP